MLSFPGLLFRLPLLRLWGTHSIPQFGSVDSLPLDHNRVDDAAAVRLEPVANVIRGEAEDVCVATDRIASVLEIFPLDVPADQPLNDTAALEAVTFGPCEFGVGLEHAQDVLIGGALNRRTRISRCYDSCLDGVTSA